MNKNNPNKPNVIIINCDDLGYGDIRCYGSEKHSTPNLDCMAREGARFTDFYMSTSVCSPSRASLLTGCYPKRIGFSRFKRTDGRKDDVVLFPGDCYGLNPEEITIAQVLKDSGYSTMLIGKWHCGDQEAFLPANFGFESYYGIPYSNDMGINTLGNTDIKSYWRDRICSYPPLPILKDKKVVDEQPDQSTLTEKYLDIAIKFIKDNKDKPFFLYFAHMYVHNPIYAPERFLDNTKNGPYGAAVECIDWAAGEIIKELKELDIDDNTIVIFTSDNGSDGIMGGSNTPLKGLKTTCWEGGLRVPCIIRWPGKIKKGTVSSEVTTVMDFLPTLAGIAGAETPKDRTIDGMDISGILYGNDNVKSRPFFYYYCGNLQAVRSGDFKYFAGSPDYPEALYNLKDDISESTDLMQKYPSIIKEMKKLLDEARTDMGDDLRGIKGKDTRPAGKVEDPVPLTEYDPANPYVVSEYDMTCVLGRLKELSGD